MVDFYANPSDLHQSLASLTKEGNRLLFLQCAVPKNSLEYQEIEKQLHDLENTIKLLEQQMCFVKKS